jgi:hypothetical protein
VLVALLLALGQALSLKALVFGFLSFGAKVWEHVSDAVCVCWCHCEILMFVKVFDFVVMQQRRLDFLMCCFEEANDVFVCVGCFV